MNDNVRQDETRGSLSDRVLVLENSLFNRWDRWFGKNPGTVLGIVVFAMVSAGWVFYTWQMERVTKEYESRIVWLKEQNSSEVKNLIDNYAIEKKALENKITDCNNKNISP